MSTERALSKDQFKISLLPFARTVKVSLYLLGFVGCKIIAPTNVRSPRDQASNFQSAEDSKFALNDASILFPPPDKMADLNFYLGLESKESSLISRKNYEFIRKSSRHREMPISDELSKRVLDYSQWKVVGFRFDPCHKTKVDSPCQGQIRLVAQPMIKPLQNERRRIPNQIFAADFGMHLIYSINPSQVNEVIGTLRELKRKYNPNSSMQPLGVHPAFLSSSREEFAQQIKKLIVTYSKEQNLNFAAFLGSAVAVTGDLPFRWLFSAYRVEKEQVIPFKIPNTEETVMRFFLAEGDGENGILPLPSIKGDSLAPALDSVRIFEDVPYAKDAINKAIRIENPNLHSAESVDCASCHIATTVRVPIESQLFGEKGLDSKDRYMNSKYNLTRNPLYRTGPLFVHNFGFINNEPIVSQRTINEAAQASDFINSIPQLN